MNYFQQIYSQYNSLIKYLTSDSYFENYLSIFRVYLSFHILKSLYFNWSSITLLIGNIFEAKELLFFKYNLYALEFLNMPIILLFTIILSLLNLFGVGKYFTSILLFICVAILNNLFAELSDGGDNLLFFLTLYMCFANTFKYFTFSSQSNKSKLSNLFSNLSAYTITFHLCLVYLISGLHKVHSDVWFNGVANYYILHINRFCSPLNHLFYNNYYFISISTYYTLFFELFFWIFIWLDKTKKWMIISGIILHLSIYFFMMIYDFELLFIAIYGFFISDKYWEKKIDTLYQKINIYLHKPILSK